MSWIAWALISAVSDSCKEFFSKKASSEIDPLTLAFSLSLFALPIVFTGVLFEGFSLVRFEDLDVLLLGSLTYCIGLFCFMKALSKSDLSLVVPLLTIAPLFHLILSPLIVGEFPAPQGLLGVLLIVVGSYCLNIKKRSHGLLEPFKALLSEPGPRFMILAAFFFSVVANIDKYGLLYNKPLAFSLGINLGVVLILAPICLFRVKNFSQEFTQNWKHLFRIGCFAGCMSISFMLAISSSLVIYVVSVKRVSVLITTLIGHFVLKEQDIRERFVGAGFMVLGVVLISLS